jgi:hypothetical protein
MTNFNTFSLGEREPVVAVRREIHLLLSKYSSNAELPSANSSCFSHPLREHSAWMERVLNRLSFPLLNNGGQNIFMNAATDRISQSYEKSRNITKRRHQGV